MGKNIKLKDCQKGKILMIMEEYFEPTGCTNCKHWNGDDEGFGSNDCLLKEKGVDCCYEADTDYINEMNRMFVEIEKVLNEQPCSKEIKP